MPLSTIISIITTAISLTSLFIAYLVYCNSRKAVKNTEVSLKNSQEALEQSKDKYIYELRLHALKSTKEAEVIWQTSINDVYHEQQNINNLETVIAQKMKALLDDVSSGLMKPSLENIKSLRVRLSDDFDKIDEEDAKLIIKEMEIINMSLRQSQQEALRKYKLMYNKIEKQLSASQD